MSAGFQGAGRYAPSPSGDLHLGNLRTAMLAWLFARSTGRQFLMRVEDLDRDRDAGTAQTQLADLSSLGLDWDGEPVRQSERGPLYEAAIARLGRLGLVYECTCTRREILEAPSAPHGAGAHSARAHGARGGARSAPGAYPGTCRNRSDAERAEARERIAPREPALRFNARAALAGSGGELSFRDQLLGTVTGAVDDLVLRRGDGTVAYNLAVVVDDAAMGIDQVVRGDDLADSTPSQLALQLALGLPTTPEIEYAHVPLVLGPSGKRLAKRDGAVTLAELVAAGVTAVQVRSRLAESLGLGDQREEVEMGTLIERFDPAVLPSEPWAWKPGD